MTYHTEKIETAIAKIHECLDAPIDPVRVRRLLKDIGKWSAEAEREAYARGKVDGLKDASVIINSRLHSGLPADLRGISEALLTLAQER